ncbi:unnamed protein product, partial [Didymodactylos carnosus]
MRKDSDDIKQSDRLKVQVPLCAPFPLKAFPVVENKSNECVIKLEWDHLKDILIDEYIVYVNNKELHRIPNTNFNEKFLVEVSPIKDEMYTIDVIAKVSRIQDTIQSYRKIIIPQESPNGTMNFIDKADKNIRKTPCITIKEEERIFFFR